MRKRFLKTAAAMMAITLVVSTCSVTALAGGESDEVTENLPNNTVDKEVNKENFNENNAQIGTNYGNIKTNNDFIKENKGTVEDNNKYIDRNAAAEETSSKGTVTNNDGNIYINDGDIDINNGDVNINNGDIDINNGHVKYNNGGATITNNQGPGKVEVNYGTIKNNSANEKGTPAQDDVASGGVYNNYHDIITNTGFVKNNQGWIGDNSGTVMNNGVDNTSESAIESMPATIINNTGTVKQNGDYNKGADAFDEKASVINKDGGVVVTNNGIVENYTGGTVTINNGAVYNYGGKVTGSTSDDFTEHGKGTEYFSVSINTENGSQVYGKEFKDYKDNKWLGQTYDFENKDWTTSSSEVTITPTSGYEIASLNIPDKYSEYVSATKNSDGTWTLSVKSGYNISLTPTATLIATSTLDNSGNSGIPGTSGNQGSTAVSVEVSVSSDSDSGSNDSGNKPAQNSNNDFQVSPPGSMMNQMMINSVDFTGQGLSAPLSEVLQKIDNITAINNFQAMGITIPSIENVMACGVVDFKNAFVNAATGNVDVPVEATVIAGNTYTVALSDGTIIEVQCTTNGILNIPFAANAQNLTFIIYGTQSNDFRLAN